MANATASPFELELKLRLKRQDVGALLKDPALVALRRGHAQRKRLVASYFDTTDRRLAQDGIALRMRREGSRWVQTVKGPSDERGGAGLAARPEFEWPRGASPQMPAVDTQCLVATPWRRELLKAVKRGLAPLITSDVERTSVTLAFPDGTSASLAVDIGQIRTESGSALQVCELEIELQEGDVEPLYRLAQTLASEHPLALEPRSKVERGFALLHPRIPEPEHARDAALEQSTNAADALAAILRACARQIEGNADGLLSDDDPEWVHQMRIGTRRLRACLALLRDFVPADLLAPVAADARWLARTLGPVRDLDVLVLEMLPLIFKAVRQGDDDAPQTPLRTFAERAAQRRVEARGAARAGIESQRFVQLILGVGALAATPRLGAPEGSPAAIALSRPARALAQPLLKRRYRKLMQRGAGLPHAPAEARHAARLAAKRLRYATEFFAVLFSRKRTRVFRQSLTRLQDVLGTMNDAEVTAQLAAEITGAGSTSAAMLRGWAAASTAAQTGVLARAWKGFQRAQPFWGRS